MLLFLTKRQKIIIRNNIFYLLKDLFLFRQRIIIHILSTIVFIQKQTKNFHEKFERSKNTTKQTNKSGGRTE